MWATLRPLFLAAAITLSVAPRAPGQLRGRIADPKGAPLSGALVEIWSPTARLAGQLSDPAGVFSFSEDVARQAALITVKRIGFQPARVTLSHQPDLTITLSPFPQTLATVTTNAPRLCPNADDKAARAVWETMRHRYQLFRTDRGVWSAARMTFGRVPPTELGAVDTTQVVDGEVATGRNYFDLSTQTIATRGYAASYQGLRQERFDSWEYPRLESFFAGHFMDSVFGALHRFSFESRAPLVLVFCPRNTKRPSIQGRLALEADSSLGKATWAFQTPEPHEDAGGEVIFAPPANDAVNPVLLPLVGLFWRKVIHDYYQEWMQFEAWHSCQEIPNARFCR
jgi:hypothetical protein